MKIERAKLKKSNSELPEACKPLRDSLAAAKDDHSMYEILKNITTWEYGKSELYHWVDVLDMFDDIMERCCQTVDGNKWMLACDEPENTELKQLMLQVMRFTSMLIEYSFQRHSYESMDHLITLMSSSDMDVVLEVLNVLYVFSKRSNFMGRLSAPKKHEIVIRLLYLAESWGGRENGFGLAECCQDLSVDSYPSSATTVHFEFYINRQSKTQPSNLCTIHLENVDRMSASPSEVMSKIMSDYEVPDNKQMLLFTHTRLAHSFSNFKQRTNCILARLQAISILVYSHAVDNEVAHQIIYTGFINELVNVLELASAQLIDMKAAVMRTLTAIIHLERNPKLEAIIDITGANTYHGFLPSLVRKCIQHMVEPAKTAQQSAASSSTAAGTTAAAVTVFPHSFSTALFSFLYHLASYESGGEALLSCGIMPSLLKLANWYSDEQEHITFVTRAVRIIDLMTNMDTQSFENHNGLKVFIDRLDHEVAICREEQPFIIRPKRLTSLASIDAIPMDVSDSLHSEADIAASTHEHSASHEASITDSQHAASASGGSEGADAQQQNDTDIVASNIEINSSEQSRRDNMELMDSQPSTSKEVIMPVLTPGLQCLPQRSALLKSILNFFKKVIPEPALSFADSIRHIMEGSMPKALQHIISNAEYYGASLFLLALDVVTVFVFQEPSLLSSLQDKGLTEIVLNSLLVKDVPTTREVLAALPNVFSALCLNQRGLDAFVEYKPFDKLFKVLLSPEYLPAMRKRKSSDAFGDTANNLGTAMDELMRHQPSLRIAAIKAIIGLLNEIIRLGTDTQYTCTSKNSDITGSSIGGSAADSGNLVSGVAQQNSDIDESEDDDEVTEGATEPTTTQGAAVPGTTATPPAVPTADADIATEQSKPVTAPKPVPLMDYIHNVMKFVDAIMGNSTADDHCMEFITQGGLEPLFTILRLPNLPVDFPTSQACQSVSSVCTILLKLCHEPKVISEGLKQLSEVLTGVSKLYEPLPPPGGSVLLSELVSAVGETGTIPEAVSNPKATPLLHNLSAVQAFVKVFVHMCRFGQADLKQISLVQWGTERGLNTLSELGKLYYSLVWEGTVLLALCSDNDLLPSDSEFGRADLAKLLPKLSSASPKDMDTDSNSSVGVTAAMEGLSTADLAASGLSVPEDEVTSETAGAGGESSTSQAVTGKKAGPTPNTQMKQIRPLLNVSSRLGSTLAELFQNVLVKLCVGSVMLRQRRTHQPPPAPSVPSANARAMSKALCELSINGLNWKPLTDANVPKLHMYFLMSVVGFSMPMLFEENKLSYHLMLQEFSNLGGTEAFFSVFYDVVNRLPPSESFRGAPTTAPPSKLPDYLVEFLDTWLLLAEKMVHPKSILDSVYSLPAKGNTTDYKPFNPTLYLKTILKPVFNAVLRLWSHKALTNTKDADANLSAQLEQVAISMLTILCHIIQAEKVIKEREAKEAKTNKTTNTGASTSTSSQTAATAAASTSGPRAGATAARGVSGPPGLAPLSDENVLLRDLMDMGFSRDRCVEALNFTSTVEAATEYLLTHMTTPTAASGSSEGQDGMELSEEDQIRAAIELSLTATAAEAAEQKKAESKPATPAEEIKPPIVYVREDDSLSSSDLDDLTDTLVSGCMNMLDSMPNTVFKICQLLVIVSNRNGNQWRENMFKQLFLEMTDVCTQLTEDALKKTWGSSKEQAVEYFTKSERNLKLASRMHLLTLLIQEVEIPCISVLQDNGFINSVLGLVSQCMPGFLLAGTAGTPQWLAPIMLIVDQCEKAGIASKRKAEAKTVLGVSTAWKWFDDRNGRWCAYNSTSNNTIDTAYKNGETSVRFTAGRRKYLVKFNAMIQLNEETGNRRPVMLTIPSKPDRDLRKMHNMEVDAEMSGLLPEQIQTLLRLCVDLISVPVECETLHAVLRLCLRCTRSHDMADLFVSCGGVDRLLKLSQASAFTGFTSLCTLIIRHILEDEQTLTITFSHVLKEVAAGIGSNLCGVSSTSMGSKEINYVMRQLGPAICRDPQLLKKVAQKQLRISLQNGKEPPWSTQHQVDLISCVEDKSLSLSQPPSETFRGILTSLLNILVDPYTKEPALDGSTDGKKSAEEGAADEVLSAAGSAAGSADLSATPNQLLQRLLTETSSTTVAATEKLKKAESKLKEMTKENPIASADNLSRPLLSKSAVLRMLSEFVKSYPSCANIVVQHSYMAGQTDSVNETCTALSFIFDRLLPGNQEDGDKDCPALSRVLLASISSCNHSPEAQTSLVNELKTALQRTLSMPEVMTKYTHIQSLTALVSTLVEACPSTQNQLNKSPFPLKQISSNSMNSMVKLMVKRGLVSDIAKIPHSLDLSNPATVNTINALLKPLETLSRIVNQPQLGPAGVTGNRPALTRNEAQISSSNLPSQQNAIEGAAATENTTPNTADTTATTPASNGAAAATNGQQTNGTSGTAADPAAEDAAEDHHEAEFDQEDEDNDDMVAENDNNINYMRSFNQELNVLERETEALSRMLSRDLDRDRPVENGSNHSLPDDDDDDRDDDRDRQRLYNVHQQVNEVLEHALDEILSQGASEEDNDDDMGLGRPAAEATMSDSEVEEAEAIAQEEREDDEEADEPPPYHEDEEPDTSDEDDDDEDEVHDDDDDEGDNHNNGDNQDGGELGIDDDDAWSDDDDIGGGVGGGGGGGGLLSNLLGLDDDDDLFSRLEAYDQMPFEGAGRPRILVAEPGAEGFRTLHVPLGHGAGQDPDSLMEEGGNTLPPAPNAVPVTHPLMNPSAASSEASRSHSRFMPGLARMRRNAGGAAASRAERLAGERMGHGLHMMSHAPQSNFLQRLFGAGMAANILQLTTRIGGTGAARLYISDDDPFRPSIRNDDEPYSDFLQDGMDLMKTGGGPGVLSSLPSTLYRWTEECRVLDGSSVHDVITAVKPEIIDKLQADKKEQIEATTKKEKEAKDKKSDDKKTTSGSTDIGNSAGSAPTESATAAGGSETERLENELRNLARNARTLADNVEDLQERLNLETLGNSNTELLNSMQALFGEEDNIAQDVARLYNRRRQEQRTLMSVPHPQPHTGTSDESAQPISTTANNTDIVSSLRAAISSAQRTLSTETTSSGSAGQPIPSTTANAPTTQATQPSDSSALTQTVSGNAIPVLAPSTREILLESLSYPLSVSLNSQPSGGEAVAAATQDTSETLTTAVQEQSNNQASLLESLTNQVTPACIEQEVDQDRACTPPNVFYDGDEPAPPPLAENRPDMPIPSTTLSTISDDNLLTARSGTEPPVELVSVAEAVTNSTAIDNSELSEDHPVVESVEADAVPTGTQGAAAADTGASQQTTTSAAAVVGDSVPGTSSGATEAPSNTSGLPAGLEGVDPSFLEALPESIRREVIAEQLRLARVQNHVRESTAAAAALTPPAASTTQAAASTSNTTTTATAGASQANSNVGDVSAEFLAALPPAIQEEVLAVQRAEQARQTAAAAGPDTAPDPGSFLNSLPPSLRQQVLADMDDSQISVLPADLMAEAQLLRGELEDRNRRLQDQLFTGGSTLGSILRQSGMSGWGGGGGGVGRLSTSRFIRRGVGGSGFNGPWGSNSGSLRGVMKPVRRGRQLLDQEALTCLLVMLFLDEPRLNVSRLHRILKNLGYHSDTLLWIVRALISILMKTNESKDKASETSQASGKQISQSAWLSFGMDAALGCRANVFHVQHNTSSKRNAASSPGGGNVTIHPQAAQLVCQHVMDTLIYLSKAFTQQFLPNPAAGDVNPATKDKNKDQSVRSKSPKQATPTAAGTSAGPSFWDVLVRLDQMRLNKKGKGVQRMSTGVPSASPGAVGADDSLSDRCIEESPMGQLMTLLSSPVIRRSPALTDRLLKLLSNISTAITMDVGNKSSGSTSGRQHSFGGEYNPFSTRSANNAASSNASQSVTGKSIIKHDSILLPNQLKLAVEVLTSKSCSEEGLEDSTKLLLRLSNANNATKQNIVKLLLSGAQQIGHTVCEHIESLLKEAQEHNRQLSLTGAGLGEDSASDIQSLDPAAAAASDEPRPSTSSATSGARGLIANRYLPGSVVTVAPPKNKRTHDLQLPSMSLLTAKSSSQQFLLRLLKVVIQLSDKKSASRSSESADAGSSQALPAAPTPTRSIEESTAAANTAANTAAGTESAAAAESSAADTTLPDPGAAQPPTESTTEPAATSGEQKMEVDTQEAASSSISDAKQPLCERLDMDKLWQALGECLTELSRNSDQNAVLILQPAVEAFFLVHAGEREGSTARSRRDRHRREDQLSHLNLDEPPPSPASAADSLTSSKHEQDLSPETKKFLKFAETHRTVLNQILRQTQTPLSDGPFSVLVDHMKLLDFDVKNRYFKAELQKLDDGMRREDLAVHVRRDHVFEDSYRELFRRTPEEWKHRLYIVFEGEEGQDAGGLLREWYLIMSREIFNPNYALFMTTPQDRVTYTINQLSYYNNEHLSYFKFVGRIIAKAIYDNKLLECYFTRSFYKHITGQAVRYTDMEAEDYSFYQGLEFLLNNDVNDLGYDLTFSTEIQELGVTQTRELKPNGSNILVTEENKKEYVKLVCQLKMTGAIRKQLNAFLEGFYDVIPKYLISIFNEQELELLISGLPTVDVDDLKANSEYHKYNANSLQIIWFWRALRSFDQAERARFLQFVTGTSKVPLQGFAYLEGMNGTQKFQIHRDDRSTDRLPCAHTCFNQLDLPAYETYDKLKKMLLLVINECSEGFGLA